MLSFFRKLKESKRGAGIIEMMIIVAIIAVLAVTIVPNVLTNVNNRATNSLDQLNEVSIDPNN